MTTMIMFAVLLFLIATLFLIVILFIEYVVSCGKWLSPQTQIRLTPGWRKLFKVDDEWDRRLNDLLDTNPQIVIGRYVAKIGETEVWIANFPYASFGEPPKRNVPSKETCIRLTDKLIEAGWKP